MIITFIAAFTGAFIGGFVAYYIINNISGPFDNSQEEQPETPKEKKPVGLSENDKYLIAQIKGRK